MRYGVGERVTGMERKEVRRRADRSVLNQSSMLATCSYLSIAQVVYSHLGSSSPDREVGTFLFVRQKHTADLTTSSFRALEMAGTNFIGRLRRGHLLLAGTSISFAFVRSTVLGGCADYRVECGSGAWEWDRPWGLARRQIEWMGIAR